MKRTLLVLSFIIFTQAIFAQQNIGINTNTPDSTAILDIVSSNKGLLIPRLSSAQRLGISNPANSLMVFDLDESALFYYSDSSSMWMKVPDKSQLYWDIKGNNIYNINIGNVGIGTDSPQKNLHIKGNGLSDAGLAMTNGDSTYSIIIILDETEEGIIVKGDNGVINTVLYSSDKFGKFGIGIKDPTHLLHLKPQFGVEPSIRISNQDSSYNIIIILDETEEGIIVKGQDNNATKTLYSSDKIARFGVGTNVASNALHIFSDTINPSIRLTRATYPFDYVLGFHKSSTNFVLERDTVAGGSASILSVDSMGDITINATNAVNVNPRVITGAIEIENEITGNSFTLSANTNGTPSWVNGLNYIDVFGNYSDTLGLSYTDLRWSSIRSSSASGFASSLASNTTVSIENSGTYEIYYRVAVRGNPNVNQLSEVELWTAPANGSFSKVSNSEIIGNHPKLTSWSNAYIEYLNQVELSRTLILELNAGDLLKLVGKTFGPNTTSLCYLYGPGCEFIVKKLD